MIELSEVRRSTITGNETEPILVQPEDVSLVRPRLANGMMGTGSMLTLRWGESLYVTEDMNEVRRKLSPPGQFMGPR